MCCVYLKKRILNDTTKYTKQIELSKGIRNTCQALGGTHDYGTSKKMFILRPAEGIIILFTLI